MQKNDQNNHFFQNTKKKITKNNQVQKFVNTNEVVVEDGKGTNDFEYNNNRPFL